MAGRIAVLFAPILALLGVAVVLAAAGVFSASARTGLLVAAGVAVVVAGLVSAAMLLRQDRQWRATSRDLRRAEAHVNELVESAMDPIITVDDVQRIVTFNAAAEAVFQRSRLTVIGQSLEMLIPPRLREAHRAHFDRFGTTGITSRRMGAHAVLTALRADGAEFPIEASISQHEQDGQKRFTVILRDVSERVKAHEALRRSKEELQELSVASHIAREQEKNRVARELHDELGQALTMLQMDVAWCKAKADGGEPEFAARLDRMQALLKSTVAATRRIAADLRPLLLDDLGIVPAVEWLAENFTQRTGVPCRLTIGDPDLELDSVRATAVFRIVQESLTNIAKHAGAADAEVSIVEEGGELVIRVSDDGRGFTPQDPRKPASFGLVGVRERAALLRGEASITSGIGEGTTIEVRLPFATEGAAT